MSPFIYLIHIEMRPATQKRKSELGFPTIFTYVSTCKICLCNSDNRRDINYGNRCNAVYRCTSRIYKETKLERFTKFIR